MRKSIPFILLLTLVALQAQTLNERLYKYREERRSAPLFVDGTTAAREIASGEAHVLDVRDAAEFRAGTLPGATSTPLDALTGPNLSSLPSGRLLIVGVQPEQAVEAAVVLRLAGVRATAVDTSYAELARLVAALSSDDKGSHSAPIPPVAVPLGAVEQRRDEHSMNWTAWTLVAAVLVIVVLVIQRWVWAPRRRLVPVQEAIDILTGNDSGHFEEAIRRLRGAIDSGLKSKDLSDARFALAYARARLGETRIEEAIAGMSELMETSPSREAAYLDLWLQVRAKRYDAAMRRYVAHGEELGDYRQTRLLGGITLLEQAFVAVGRQAYDEAVQLFKQLLELGVLNEHVPADLVDQQVAFAVEALLSSETDKAREGFGRAAQEATIDSSVLYARVGLTLCDWRSDSEADLDGALRDLVKEANALFIKTQAAGVEGPTAALDTTPNKVAAPAQEPLPEERALTPVQLLVRNLRLMYAVSQLRNFKRLPPGRRISKGSLKELWERLASVREIDPAMGDPLLIEGLMRYYFADSNDERSRALAQLDDAAQREISVPEVNYLIECEKALAKLQENSARDFLALLKLYLGEETVPLVYRQKLQDELKNTSLLKEIGNVNLQPSASPKDAALSDLMAVSGILHRRVERLLGHGKDERTTNLLNAIKDGTNTVSEHVSELYHAHTELIAATAEHLLKEEETHKGRESKTTK